MNRQPNAYGGNEESGYPPYGATRPMYNDGDDDNDGGDDDALDSDDDSEPNGNGGKQRGGRGAPGIKHRRKATQRPVVRIYPRARLLDWDSANCFVSGQPFDPVTASKGERPHQAGCPEMILELNRRRGPTKNDRLFPSGSEG